MQVSRNRGSVPGLARAGRLPLKRQAETEEDMTHYLWCLLMLAAPLLAVLGARLPGDD